ncbi:MAG: transposase [Deltaproteobacteria bacterium]|nr:transposase [Deltaproteobacteria bacterium]
MAYEALSMISTLFKVVAESNRISKLSERDAFRVKHATPLVDTFDAWMKQARTRAEPRGRIETALNYATNLHDARRAFLADPRLKVSTRAAQMSLRASSCRAAITTSSMA